MGVGAVGAGGLRPGCSRGCDLRVVAGGGGPVLDGKACKVHTNNHRISLLYVAKAIASTERGGLSFARF